MAGEMDEDPGKNGHKNQEMESLRKHWYQETLLWNSS